MSRTLNFDIKNDSKKYRHSLEIVEDMLRIASERTKKTSIMYKANLSHSVLEKYLKYLLEKGLLERDDSCFYSITRKGKEFLQMYSDFLERNKKINEEIGGIRKHRLFLEAMCFKNEMRPAPEKPVMRTHTTEIGSTASKGVILAAGDGVRIKRITYGGFPKELLPIGTVPTIRFAIEAMNLAGIKDILVVIAAQTKHGIIDGLQSGERFGVRISYVVQEKNEKCPPGLGTAILSTRGRIESDEDFVVACGDSIICDFSSSNPFDCLRPLIEVHKSTDALATLMVHPTKADPTRFGVVKFRSLREENGIFYGELENLVEKPDLKTAESLMLNGYYYVAVGYYVFKPSIFSYIEKTKVDARNEIQITDAMISGLENGEKICALVHAKNKGKNIVPCEYWDVGIPEDYKEANKRLLDMNLDRLMV